MEPLALLSKAKGAGLEVRIEGESLVVRGPKTAFALVQEIREHKAEIMDLLSRAGTLISKGAKPEKLTDLRSSTPGAGPMREKGHPSEPHIARATPPVVARLYPLLERRVQTTRGPGHLWQVFSDRVGVVLDSNQERVTFMAPADVLGGIA